MILRLSKSQNATLKTASYCILVFSFVYAIPLIIWDSIQIHLQLYNCRLCNSYSLTFDHAIASALNIPLTLLCTAQSSLMHTSKTCSDFIFSTPNFLQQESIFLSFIFQMDYVYDIDRPFFIPVCLVVVTCMITLPG